MTYTEARKRATAKYKAARYGRIAVDMQLEEVERWKEEAARRGESIAEFVRRAVRERIERENPGNL